MPRSRFEPASGSSALTNTHTTVVGRVTDTTSGVASLQASVDVGAFTNVAMDAAGNFSFTDSLSLDGSAEGPHTIHLRANDKAGNTSALSNVQFTLDTVPPVVA